MIESPELTEAQKERFEAFMMVCMELGADLVKREFEEKMGIEHEDGTTYNIGLIATTFRGEPRATVALISKSDGGIRPVMILLDEPDYADLYDYNGNKAV